MTERTADLAEKIKAFSDAIIAYVESMTSEEWDIVCDWEQWTTGVTAYHIGNGHLAIFNIAGMIVKGEALPPLTLDQITDMANQQAEDNASCTKTETLQKLKENGEKLAAFITGLNDEDLDRKGSMPAFEGEVTTGQLIEMVVLESAVLHFDNIKKALAR